ncbi:MAG TPA: hypothetical protein VF765_26385 [Polyangiaceae bacterium]
MVRLRLCLLVTSAAVLASFASLEACGSMSNASFAGGNPCPGNDCSGNDSGSGDVTTDAINFGDSAGDVADSAAPDTGGLPPPGVLLVHGSPSLPDEVFCWSVGANPSPSMTDRPYPFSTPMPASNYPGVPVGGAVALADASSMMGGDLTVYALDAQAVAQHLQGKDCVNTTECSCFNVMNGLNVLEKHQLPAIPGGSIVPGATVVLWLRGCLVGDQSASLQRCGADWMPTTGNLRMDLAPVPGALLPAPEAGVFTVQAAQLSPSLAFAAGDAGAVVSFGAQGAADASIVTTLSAPDQVQPTAPMQLAANVPLASFGQLGFSVDVPGDGGAHLWMSLAQSLNLIDPTQNPSQYFSQPTSYLVTVLGDPGGVPPGVNGDAGYDGTGLHLLVLPLP